jgi:hypothetical protein
MPNQPEHKNNGHTPMTVDPGYDKDPLRPKQHQVLLETAPGQWTIVAKSTEPIEMLGLVVARDHAIAMQRNNMMIVGENRVVEAAFENYIPKPQDKDADISPENKIIRDRFVKSIITWLLPRELANAEPTPESQEAIKACMAGQKIELAINPQGTQVLFYRDGEILTAWSAV